jgi:hypothetical protein
MNAKSFCAAMVVAALGAGQAAQAGDLYSISPANTSFTATGMATVSGPEGAYSCTATMGGTTATSKAQVNSVAFSGAPGCENVMANGLPWKVKAISGHKLQILHVTLVYPGLGRCGPNEVNAPLRTGTMVIQDHLPSKLGVCAITASLVTSPSLSITK